MKPVALLEGPPVGCVTAIPLGYGCPFCGGEGLPASAPDEDRIQHTVVCRSCAAEGPWALTPEGAIENWSKRV